MRYLTVEMQRTDAVSSEMNPRKRSLALPIAVAVIIVVAISATWIILSYQSGTPRAHTMLEYYQFGPRTGPVGLTWPIEDVVTERDNITTPGLGWNESGDFWVDPHNRTDFTRVEFESFSDFHLHFIGNRVADFPVGQKVRFDIIIQEFSEGGQTVVTTEHTYATTLLTGYDFALRDGEYAPFETNVTIAAGNVTIRFASVTDFYPLPANWGTIDVEFFAIGFYGVDSPGNGSLYDGGNFIGRLIGSSSLGNSSIDMPLKPGQELIVPYDGSYVAIWLMNPFAIGTIIVA